MVEEKRQIGLDSLTVSAVLDALGYTSEIKELRIATLKLIELICDIVDHPNPHPFLVTGSRAEGTTIKESDNDLMTACDCVEDNYAIVKNRKDNPNVDTIFLLREDNAPTGFALLEILSIQKTEVEFASQQTATATWFFSSFIKP